MPSALYSVINGMSGIGSLLDKKSKKNLKDIQAKAVASVMIAPKVIEPATTAPTPDLCIKRDRSQCTEEYLANNLLEENDTDFIKIDKPDPHSIAFHFRDGQMKQAVWCNLLNNRYFQRKYEENV